MQWHKGAPVEMFLVEDDGQVAYKKVWSFREPVVGKDNSIIKNTTTMLPRI